MNELNAIADEEIVTSLLPMFLEDTRQKIEGLDALLEPIRCNGKTGEPYLEFMRIAHSIKGIAPTFGFSTVAIIAHKLEDYMHDVGAVSQRDVDQIYLYIDSMLRIIDTGENPDEANEADVLRRLPSPMDFSDFAIDQKVVQTLFIGPKNVQFAMFELELKSCGFNVTNSQNSFQAMEIAVRMKPDLIMVCNVIDTLNGIEVAHALRTFNVTRYTPMIFITSDVSETGRIKAGLRARLPAGVEIVRKTQFPDDFATAIIDLGLV